MALHHNLRRYQGPGVWAHVRTDYLAGEPARVVADRYGVSVASLRKRSSEEGWTRAAHARAADPGPPPGAHAPAEPRFNAPDEASDLEEMAAGALQRAGRQIAEGRGAEAAATLKAVEALRRLHADLHAAPAAAPPAGASGSAGAPAPDPAEELAALEAARDAVMERADALARHLLAGKSGAAVLWSGMALHWRARHLGPEAAAADHAAAVTGGWAPWTHDAEGRLLPLADLLASDRLRFGRTVAPDHPRLAPIEPDPAWLAPIVPAEDPSEGEATR